MKKNIFDLFLNRMLNVPFWIKQAIYIRLAEEMKEYYCEDFLRNNSQEIFSAYVPVLTFEGRTELAERKCGLDSNIYNFLEYCADDLNILGISVNMFLSMEEVAKYFELCIEQNFIKTPESKAIIAMAGFIAGKFRTGEYFNQREIINFEQLQQAIQTHENKSDNSGKFGEVLVDMGLVSKQDLKSVLTLKEEAKKRFVLDYNDIPKIDLTFVNSAQKYQEEITKLREENKKLKKNLKQLLALVKKNA